MRDNDSCRRRFKFRYMDSLSELYNKGIVLLSFVATIASSVAGAVI